MTKKLFAFDLDGTLLNKEEKIIDEIVVGLDKLRELGHEVCIITGRSWNMTSRIYERTKMTTPAGSFNGGVIEAANDKTFKTYVNYLSEEKVNSILNNSIVAAYARSITVESKHQAYVSNLESNSANLQRRWSSKEPLQLENDSKLGNVIAIFVELNTLDHSAAEEISKAITAEHSNLEVNFWFSSFTNSLTLEVTDALSRKDFALIRLAKHFNIDMKNTIAFGDGNNDQHMLMAAGLGVAMLNANDTVKSHADDVTTYDNNANGVMRYIFEKLIKE